MDPLHLTVANALERGAEGGGELGVLALPLEDVLPLAHQAGLLELAVFLVQVLDGQTLGLAARRLLPVVNQPDRRGIVHRRQHLRIHRLEQLLIAHNDRRIVGIDPPLIRLGRARRRLAGLGRRDRGRDGRAANAKRVAS